MPDQANLVGRMTLLSFIDVLSLLTMLYLSFLHGAGLARGLCLHPWYSRPRFKDAWLKSTPRFQDDIFSRSMVPRRC